jgi:dienelactone hydrolase
MTTSRFLAFFAATAALHLAAPAHAQSIPPTRTTPVGMPGCGQDVPLAATRASITFASGGKDIPAILYEPQGVPHASTAVVILHGREVAGEMIYLDDHALQLASRGVSVLLPFYLAADDGRDPEPARARAAHRTWRRVALDAAEALAAERGVSQRQVHLWGHTRGGGVAVAAALERGSPVGGAIAVQIGGRPQDSAEGLGRPFLLIYAPDALFPAAHGRAMADAIREDGGVVEEIRIGVPWESWAGAEWCAVFDHSRAHFDRSRLSAGD